MKIPHFARRKFPTPEPYKLPRSWTPLVRVLGLTPVRPFYLFLRSALCSRMMTVGVAAGLSSFWQRRDS
jgi:hypothetical protein